METHPCKISTESVPTITIVWIELEERTIKLGIGKPLDIHLRGYKDKYTKNERNEQPFESFAEILACTPEIQCKP
jgi:hypothetical protein